jgi:hypothetical protein
MSIAKNICKIARHMILAAGPSLALSSATDAGPHHCHVAFPACKTISALPSSNPVRRPVAGPVQLRPGVINQRPMSGR